jgi:hypothetical protein
MHDVVKKEIADFVMTSVMSKFRKKKYFHNSSKLMYIARVML